MSDHPGDIPVENLERFGQQDRSSIHWWRPDGTIHHLFIDGFIPREVDRREIIQRVSKREPFGALLEPVDGVDEEVRPLLDPDLIVLYVKMSGFDEHPGQDVLEEMKRALAEDLGWY